MMNAPGAGQQKTPPPDLFSLLQSIAKPPYHGGMSVQGWQAALTPPGLTQGSLRLKQALERCVVQGGYPIEEANTHFRNLQSEWLADDESFCQMTPEQCKVLGLPLGLFNKVKEELKQTRKLDVPSALVPSSDYHPSPHVRDTVGAAPAPVPAAATLPFSSSNPPFNTTLSPQNAAASRTHEWPLNSEPIQCHPRLKEPISSGSHAAREESYWGGHGGTTSTNPLHDESITDEIRPQQWKRRTGSRTTQPQQQQLLFERQQEPRSRRSGRGNGSRSSGWRGGRGDQGVRSALSSQEDACYGCGLPLQSCLCQAELRAGVVDKHANDTPAWLDDDDQNQLATDGGWN